jgi:hypothetical protein
MNQVKVDKRNSVCHTKNFTINHMYPSLVFLKLHLGLPFMGICTHLVFNLPIQG